ncbi:hypothetical protein NW841_10835 [Synechococcus sp. H60.3]
MWRDVIGLALAATLLLISKTAADTLGESKVPTLSKPEPIHFVPLQ